MREWWNRQTRQTQNPLVEISCGFDSHHLYHYGSIVQRIVHRTSNPRIKVRFLVGSPKTIDICIYMLIYIYIYIYMTKKVINTRYSCRYRTSFVEPRNTLVMSGNHQGKDGKTKQPP